VTLPQAEPTKQQPALVARVLAILTSPDTEWQKIDQEPATIGSLYTGYIMILAAIPVVAQLLGSLVFGYGAFGIVYRPSFMGALGTAIVSYVLTLAGTFILALIIDALAPTFLGQRNQVQALKVAAYSATASWLAGIFHLIPALGILAILGLYSLYLFYRGLPVLMKTPQEKAIPYTLVIMLIGIVVFVLIGFVTASIVGTGAMVGGLSGLHTENTSGTNGGTLSLPGGGQLDLGKLQQAAKNIEDATKNAQNGNTTQPGISTDALKRFLPDSLPGGLARHDVSTGGGQIAGFGGSGAEAKYGTGDSSIDLTVVDLGTMGALAALGTSLGISGNQETETGYSKMGTVGNRTMIEEYDRKAKTGKYTVMLYNRFMVNAEGNGVQMDDLKGAVNAVDLATLEKMAK
jgi:hypothetical protein